MSRGSRIAVGMAFAAVVAAVALAPFPLLLVPNPAPTPVQDLSRQLPGDFINSGGITYHVFPRAEQQTTFPPDSLSAGKDAAVIVKYRQLAALASYTLHEFESGKPVPLVRETTPSHLLVLRPKKGLERGRYYAVIARESIYGGNDYVYFAVSR